MAVFFSMISLKDFDVQMSRFSVSGFLTASWTDDRLTWQPSDRNNISSLLFYQGDILIPGLFLWNSHASIDMVGFDEVPVRTTSSGSTNWNPGEVFEKLCDAVVTYFPFDTQKCTMDILPYGYNMDEMIVAIDESLASSDPTSLTTMYEVANTRIYLTDMNKSFTYPLRSNAVHSSLSST